MPTAGFEVRAGHQAQSTPALFWL